MHIILFGAPGVGKGTQAKLISNRYNIKVISTGNILRNEINKNTILGNKIKKIINSGKLINDEIIIKIIKKYIIKKNTKNGILLDGFPRTIEQAYAIKNINFKINLVLELIASNDILIQRIISRRIDPHSGNIYNITNMPDKIKNNKNINKLIIRKDDNIDIAKKRIKAHLINRKQIINFYKNESKRTHIKFYKINCNTTIEKIHKKISKIIDNEIK